MASSNELKLILTMQENATKEIANVKNSMNNLTQEAQRSQMSFLSLSTAMAAGQAIYSVLANVISRVATSLKDLTAESIVMSGQLQQSQAVVYQLGANNGWAKEKIDELIYSIRSENKDMLTSVDLTKAAILANLDEAQALEVVARGRDVAAASNTNSNEAIKAMISSLIRLSPQLLEQYGIQFNLNQVYKETADSLDKTVSELTAAERRQAFFNAMMKEASETQGAYNQAMGTWYKLSNSVKDASNDVKLVIGDLLDDALEPIYSELLQVIRQFRAWAFTSENEINPQLRELAKIIGGIVLTAFELFKKAIEEGMKIFAKLRDVIAEHTPEIQQLFSNIIRTIELLRKVWEEDFLYIRTITTLVFGLVVKFIGVQLQTLNDMWTFALDVLTGNWSKAWQSMKNLIAPTWNLFIDMVQSGVNGVIGILNHLIDGVNYVFDKVGLDTHLNDLSLSMDNFRVQVDHSLDTTGNIWDEFSAKIDDTDLETPIIAFNQAAEDMGDATGKGAKDAEDNLGKLVDAYEDLTMKVAEKLASIRDEHEKTKNEILKSVDEIRQSYESLTTERIEYDRGYNTSVATEFAKQENLIDEIRKNIWDLETDITNKKAEQMGKRESLVRNNLQVEINKMEEEKKELNKQLNEETAALQMFNAYQRTLAKEIDDEKVMMMKTDFERRMRDLILTRTQEDEKFALKKAAIDKEYAALEEKWNKEQEGFTEHEKRLLDIQAEAKKQIDEMIKNSDKLNDDVFKAQMKRLQSLSDQAVKTAEVISTVLKLSGQAMSGNVDIAGLNEALTNVGNNVNITINGDVSGEEVAEKIGDRLTNILKMSTATV